MLLRVIAACVLVLVVSACSSATTDEAPSNDLVVQEGDSVEVHYVLTLEDGSVEDSSRDTGVPLSFVVGSGRVIAGFDEAVRGLTVGSVVDVEIAPEDAYGLRDESAVAEVEITESQQDVAVGDTVWLTDGREVVVIEIADDVATVDLNHPLAGETLFFEIELVSITRG